MRVRCPYCQAKAIITHTIKVSNTVTEIYINCTGKECGARSVMKLSHYYTVAMPQSTLLDSLHEQIANLNPELRRQLLQMYCR